MKNKMQEKKVALITGQEINNVKCLILNFKLKRGRE